MIRQDIQQISILKGMGREHLKILLPLFTPCYHQPLKVIFSQGEDAAYLYFLAEGAVAVSYKPYDSSSVRLTQVNPGGVFGWSAVLGRGKYSMTATTLDESVSFRVKGKDLYKLCQNYPETGIMVIENLAVGIADKYRSTRQFVISILTKSMGIEELFVTG